MLPPFRNTEWGSLDGKGGKDNHPLILTLESFTSHTELIFVGKKIRKKKSYTLVVIVELVFSCFLWLFFG